MEIGIGTIIEKKFIVLNTETNEGYYDYDLDFYGKCVEWANENNATIEDKGEYFEVIEVLPPTQEELDKIEAMSVKSNLRNIAVNAMMMNLAGDDLEETKNTYQTKLRSISDGAALKVPELFPHWSGNSKEYIKDDKVLYNDVLYKVLQNHTSQEGWTPTSAPSLFAKVLTSEGEILDWEQPDSTNPYMKGDKVKFKGKIYESLIDNNVWSPEGYPAGWKEIEEA